MKLNAERGRTALHQIGVAVAVAGLIAGVLGGGGVAAVVLCAIGAVLILLSLVEK